MVKNKGRNKNKEILQVTLTVCISFTNVTSHIKECDVLWIHKSFWALLQTRQVALKLNSSFFLFHKKAPKRWATNNYEEQTWQWEKIKVRSTVVCMGFTLNIPLAVLHTQQLPPSIATHFMLSLILHSTLMTPTQYFLLKKSSSVTVQSIALWSNFKHCFHIYL